jgi:hypothetical protein
VTNNGALDFFGITLYRGISMLLARRLGAAALAVAAVVVWFGLRPAQTPTPASDFRPQIATALANYRLNNANAQYSPQQAVVNGWAAKDLLTVIAREQNAALSPQTAPRDDRIPAELVLLVLAVALLGGTSPNTPASTGGESPQVTGDATKPERPFDPSVAM